MAKRELNGASKQLWEQVEKWSRMSNLGSKTSRRTNKGKMSIFVQFVGREYGLQHLKNLSDKHLLGYLEWAEAQGYSSSTIKNTLSAVRWYHNQLPKTRNKLSSNEELAMLRNQVLPNRQYIGTGKNRAWTKAEVENGLRATLSGRNERPEMNLAIRLARYFGLREHEITKLERTQIKQALDVGFLTVKGKGGLIRDVPISSKEGHDALIDALKETHATKQKVFVEQLGNTHKVIRSMQSWLYRHRNEFAEKEGNLTMHGLRHMYAQERYEETIRKNEGDEKAARLEVAELLGHGRDWVTQIYLDK